MIEVDVVLRSGKVETMYFSVLPRVGENITVDIPSIGICTCQVRSITHSPSTSRYTVSRITIHL